MTKKIIITIISFWAFNANAQTSIPIPDTLSGSNIDLYLKDTTHQFFTGFNTATRAYNGSYLGPTVILNQGQNVTLNVHNQLTDTTTTHWHGLHVAPMNDGSPHNMIMAGNTWSPSFTNMDLASTCWYHPHLHGKTMKQVMQGASGLIIIRDAQESALALPRTYGIDDIPLICQWKRFDSTTKQIILDDELDNAVVVNGTINGKVNVPAQMVRFRLLNGCSNRFFYFAINDNRTFWQIAGDESLLNAPVSMTKLMLAPGERAEVVVDFSGQSGNTYYLKQLGTQLPSGYPGGPTGMMGGTPAVLDNTDFNILQFDVIPATANAITSLPTALITNQITSSTGAGTMNFQLQGSPMMSMTNFTINGVQYVESTMNFYTKQDSVMIWNITNQSMMPHPWHIHGNHFFVQSINGSAPPANMQGRKDVVVVPPQGGNVKLIMKYLDFSDTVMPYMYHCHINSHEDNGMMGQFIVGPPIHIHLGTNEVGSADFSVYPNPVINEIKLEANGTFITNVSIKNVLGQILYRNKGGLSSYDILTSTWSQGIYFLEATMNQKTYKIKFVKQ